MQYPNKFSVLSDFVTNVYAVTGQKIVLEVEGRMYTTTVLEDERITIFQFNLKVCVDDYSDTKCISCEMCSIEGCFDFSTFSSLFNLYKLFKAGKLLESQLHWSFYMFEVK